jgi:hypothetical protein
VAAAFYPAGAAWQKAAQRLALYGLTIPVLGGLVCGASPAAMLRDIVPFLFLLLPLFAGTLIAARESCRRLLTASTVMAGLIFAFRVVAPVIEGQEAHGDPLYLANAPTVLFAGLLLTGLAGRELWRGATLYRVCRAAALAATAFLPLAAMALTLQRASLGMMVLYAAVFLFLSLLRHPARAALPLLAAAILIVAGWEAAAPVLHAAAEKTTLVGVNMRWQEALAVFDRLSDSFLPLLFGRGWGATVASPAVGGMTVGFTHSLITSYWLKTGLCGLVLVLLYLFQMALLLAGFLPVRSLLAAAVALPLLIDVTLYASFKSLDFGLILLLIPLWADKVATKSRRL